MSLGPLAGYEAAKRDALVCRIGGGCDYCRALVILAHCRLALSALGYILTVILTLIVFVAIVWLWSLTPFGSPIDGPSPIPTNYQLPTT